MNKSILSIFLFIFFCTSLSAQKIRVACVGNSITYGAGIANREKNSYPAQLQNILGKGYEVMNFGHSGATLLKNTVNPYWKTKAYTDALASKPDIVLIKLGTNDSKAANRSRYNEFEPTYKELINSFSKLPTRPRIILLLPVASFLTDSNHISNKVLLGNIIPMIQHVAFEQKLELINLFPLFVDKPDLLPDKIHPSAIGATLIASRLYEAITYAGDKRFDIFSKLKEQKNVTNFKGFDCAEFKFNGRDCKVVKPKVAAKGKPWVLRARFWGHEPQTDVSLLERGFHVVYCDVAELFGNAESVGLWDKFYNLMQQCGLSKKVTLEGMSRGGVYVYNWALVNPEKVACMVHVVGDADDGVNHHPHSLQDTTPITNFILAATGQKVNFAAIAAPGSEYRSGAGWTGNEGWWGQFENIDSVMMAGAPLDVLFLGNSITQGTGGHRTKLTYKPGFKAFDSAFVNLKWESAGISGDRTQNILWRLQNGNYSKAHPKVMVVMIGVNNISAGDTPAEVVAGINKVTDWTTKNMPSTKVLLLGPLPTGLKKDEERRKKYEEIHRLLAKQSHSKFKYQSIATPFLLPNGDLDPLKYGSDGIHLLPEGYKAWATALKPIIAEMLKRK